MMKLWRWIIKDYYKYIKEYSVHVRWHQAQERKIAFQQLLEMVETRDAK